MDWISRSSVEVEELEQMRETVKITVSQHGHRRLASTGSPWEPQVGYSRAVRVGDLIAVTGTLGIESDGSIAPSLEAQTRRAMAIVLAAIEALGGTVYDVIRTRIYVTDISRWKEVGEVHAEFFGVSRPAATMIQVAGLLAPEAMIEIEADAFVGSGGPSNHQSPH